MKKIAVFIGSRANYGRLKSVLDHILSSPLVELQLILGASFYNADIPYPVASRIQCLINSDDHEAMAITTGVLLPQIAHELTRLKPDVLLVHGDRYEVLAAAIASSYLNIPLAHTEGGESTGCIDDKVRNAITALADIHLVVNREALKRMMYHECVHVVGSPALDNLLTMDLTNNPTTKPYVLILYHPNTTKQESIQPLLNVLELIPYHKIWINPNVDAGNKEILKQVHSRSDIEFVKDLPPQEYYALLKHCKCAIGNSSSFIKEGAFLGVPVVLVGDRQENRDHASNVIQVPFDDEQKLLLTIMAQIDAKYRPSFKFGDGTSGQKIVEILKG